MSEIRFQSPVALVTHLYRHEDDPQGICREPSLLFDWYSQAKRFYDASLCPVCKKRMSQTDIEAGYAGILHYDAEQKTLAALAVGSAFVLELNGLVLGKVEYPE